MAGPMSEAAPDCAYHVEIGKLRLGKFDLGGVLYHANYFHVYETAREALLEHADFPYAAIMDREMHLPLVESHQSFIRPVRYRDSLAVDIWLSELKQSSFKFNYLITVAGAAQAVHRAWTRVSAVRRDGEDFRPVRVPEDLRAALAPYTAA